MHWTTVFDVRHDIPGWTSLIPLLFGVAWVFVGLAMEVAAWLHAGRSRDAGPVVPVFGTRPQDRGPPRGVGAIVAVFGGVAILIGAGIAFGSRSGLGGALTAGEAQHVEGVVTNFQPMPWACHGVESFDVGGQHFEYADCQETGGFNRSGVLHEGERVRIDYEPVNGNVIVKLDVAAPGF